MNKNQTVINIHTINKKKGIFKVIKKKIWKRAGKQRLSSILFKKFPRLQGCSFYLINFSAWLLPRPSGGEVGARRDKN